jgi:hypothetical protein
VKMPSAGICTSGETIWRGKEHIKSRPVHCIARTPWRWWCACVHWSIELIDHTMLVYIHIDIDVRVHGHMHVLCTSCTARRDRYVQLQIILCMLWVATYVHAFMLCFGQCRYWMVGAREYVKLRRTFKL